jgi:FAD/FMN-containing dehydrogenase
MNSSDMPLIDTLTRVLGESNVITDVATRELYSSDVYSRGKTCTCVARPGSIDELAVLVAEVTGQGYAVIPRGGGMSYTSGYTPVREKTVTIDMTRMNNVLEVNTEDMYVTVEAGVTWKQLYETLKPLGVRPPVWGTLSGIHATVGGGLSQGAMFFGSGHEGTVADTVLGITVVLADGTVIKTGAGRNTKPFFRWYGPDLTGLFLNDTGALGIKGEISLRLVRWPETADHASFAFERYAPMVEAMAEIARQGLAAECFGFDPVLQGHRMRRESLGKDLRSLAAVARNQSGLLKGIKEGAKVISAGRGFMDDVRFSFHVSCEGRNEAAVAADIEACRKIVTRSGGREIANTIPKALHAAPFTPLNNMLGPEGQRWLPVHGHFPLSDATSAIDQTHALFSEHQSELEKYNIEWGYLLATISNNALVFEPVFFWPDQWLPLQRATVEPKHLAKLSEAPANPAATAAVERLKLALCELFMQLGATHSQIGKVYLYKNSRASETWKLLEELKDVVDPQRLMNPGSLGLD